MVTLGPGDPESRAHSPNESIALANYALGTKHMARLLLAFAGVDTGAAAGAGAEAGQ